MRMKIAEGARHREPPAESTPVMEPALRAAVEAVHASPLRAVMHVTGGGAQSVGWIAAVPGASRTLIDARVPYARESMADALGAGPPAQFVSASTARDMAVAAYRRGARLCGGDRHLVGLGCTCALASQPPKRGEHRCHVATFGARGFAEYHLTMEKGRRDRWEEDGLASALVVQALADAAAEAEADGDSDARHETHHQQPSVKRDDVMAGRVVPPGDVFERTRTPLGDPLEYLISGDGDVVEFDASSGVCTAVGVAPQPNQAVVLPGSFNPLHDGHRSMLRAAMATRPPGSTPVYELAVTNADKGTLPTAEVRRRVAQFAGGGDDSGASDEAESSSHPRLWLTRAPLYSQKAALMPGATFVLGHDTAVRLLNPKYYGGEGEMRAALRTISDAGCTFVVAGRVEQGAPAGDGAGRFLTLRDVDVPTEFVGMFEDLGEWRMDVSSTALRAARDAKESDGGK